MDEANQQTAYHDAFEHANARHHQLSRELESLEKRHAALLSASKALETMIAQRAQQLPESNLNSSAVGGNNHPAVHADQNENWQWKQPVTKTYVHDGRSATEIERRIDLAIGR